MDLPSGDQILEVNSNIQNQNHSSKQPSLPDLSRASRKMSEMNIMIVQKLSIIVAEYFDSIEKLQTSYKQIAVLIEYNKRLIDVLNEFEEQQQKLIARLRRMQQVYIDYMRGFCLVKSKQFKMPSLPEYNSIFQKINLQQLAFVQQEHQTTIIDLNYKHELMEILQNFFLTNQTTLLSKIQTQLLTQIPSEDKLSLAQIKQMIINYNEALKSKNQQKLLDLLRLRSQIRRKVQQYYDKSKYTQVKPDYEQEGKFINKVINLHAKLEQMNKDAILHYLNEEKQTRSTIEKSRVQIQSTFQKKCDELQVKSQLQKEEISELKSNNNKMQIQMKQLQKLKDKEIFILNRQIDQIKNQIVSKTEEIQKLSLQEREYKKFIVQLQQLNKQLSLQIGLLSQKKQTNEQQAQTTHTFQLSQITWDIISIDKIADNQAIERLQTQIKQLSQQKSAILCEIQQKNKKIQLFKIQLVENENMIQKLYQTKKKQIELIQQQLKLTRQENDKYQADKLLVQNLANKVCQAINLVSSMDLSKPIKQKLSDISKKLQFFLAQYQKDIEWNIQKQAPGYFHQFSMMTNLNDDAVSPSQQNKVRLAQKRGYSFQINNVNLIKEMLDFGYKKQPVQRQFQSQMYEKPPELDYPVALDLSNQADQRNLQQQYNNLYKTYQQCLECLQMEEKKSKALQLQYQKVVQAVYEKQKLDPEKYSLEKQIVYLTKLSIEQKETIETQRKQYNQIFRDFHSQFKSKAASEIKSLRAQSFDVGYEHKQHKQFL